MDRNRDIDAALTRLMTKRPVFCSLCRGRMVYVGSGTYKCEKCEHEELDDFGKVRQFLEANGPMPAIVIAQATGVDKDLVVGFLKKGRLEIPEGSKFYLKCEKCGCALKSGRYCEHCIREISGNIKQIFYEDMGEKPKHEGNDKMKGKMHFL